MQLSLFIDISTHSSRIQIDSKAEYTEIIYIHINEFEYVKDEYK